MFHSYSIKDKVKKYRYYVCVNAQKKGYAVCPTRSVNAQEMEDAVYDLLPKQEIKDSLLAERYRTVLEKTRERWQKLTADEKHRVMKHLLREIDYNGEAGTLGMTVNEKGIESLYEEYTKEDHEIRV